MTEISYTNSVNQASVSVRNPAAGYTYIHSELTQNKNIF